jgi:hypothetical protein
MELKPYLEGHTLVVRGLFNPAILQPMWFAKHNLIRSHEAETAEIVLINPDISNFSTDWFQLQVTQQHFQISTVQVAYYEALRDLVAGTFKLLEHTPLSQIGINFHYHFNLESEDAWHSLGNMLAPKEFWSHLLQSPGMRTLTIEGQRPDDEKGFIRATVEPSVQIRQGVYVSINDHFELEELASGDASSSMQKILELWKPSQARAEKIAHSIVKGDK